MISAQAATLTLEAQRALAWDQVASGELAFDFGPPSSPSNKKLAPETRGWEPSGGGIKDTIIRWLEEQL